MLFIYKRTGIIQVQGRSHLMERNRCSDLAVSARSVFLNVSCRSGCWFSVIMQQFVFPTSALNENIDWFGLFYLFWTNDEWLENEASECVISAQEMKNKKS